MNFPLCIFAYFENFPSIFLVSELLFTVFDINENGKRKKTQKFSLFMLHHNRDLTKE